MTGLSRVRADTVGTITTLSTPATKEPLKKREEIVLDILEVTPDALAETKPNRIENGYLISPISLDEIKNCEAFKTECCGIIIPKEELIGWYNSNTELPCPHCRAPLRPKDLIEPSLIKKAIQNKRIYLFAMSFFACIGITDITLAITAMLLEKDFYDTIPAISLTLISLLGLVLSVYCYSKKSSPIEDLV
ncbi:MAG: hypothetical protein K1060chlam4_00903 [Candidatus Anoxychlamydiales bacterium]|nr:hypothetical protein [Candidatus Anoxychlamydiales bacterium]